MIFNAIVDVRSLRARLALESKNCFELRVTVASGSRERGYQASNEKLRKDIATFDYIWRECEKESQSLAPFHACFMPKFCSTQVNAALDCANKNNQELVGCDKQGKDTLFL
jgi:hypothetical protein